MTDELEHFCMSRAERDALLRANVIAAASVNTPTTRVLSDEESFAADQNAKSIIEGRAEQDAAALNEIAKELKALCFSPAESPIWALTQNFIARYGNELPDSTRAILTILKHVRATGREC